MTERVNNPEPEQCSQEIRAALEAGLALYNDGEYHAAHDPLEAVWLHRDHETDTARLLQGLIQLTATVYHARSRNWSGAAGLAVSGQEYLDPPVEDHGVDIDTAREYLDALHADLELIDRASPPRLSFRGTVPSPGRLSPAAVGPAAEALAEEYQRYDTEAVRDATRYAGEQRGTGRTTFLTLLGDFVENPDDRNLIHQRLVGHVERRRRESDDVAGLFE